MNGIRRDVRVIREHRKAHCLLFAFALMTSLCACRPEAPVKETQGPGKAPPTAWKGEDILALWDKRYEKVPEGSFDSPLPKLDEKKLGEAVDRIFTALSTARSMQRFAKTAREELLAQPTDAVAGLAAFLADSQNDGTSKARALALFAGQPHPLLTTLCLQHLDDPERLIRLECVRRIDEARSLGSIPRLLRRTREFYEEDPEILATIYRSLAHVGNLFGVANLLDWLGRDDLRALGGAALIDIVGLYGAAYVEADGWAGLAEKARTLRDLWQEKGSVAFNDPRKSFTDEDRYLRDREYWLFLRHLTGKELRIVDEARYIGEHAGRTFVPLLRESLRDERLRQRFHSLEVVMTLGPVARSAQDEVRPLLDQPLDRSYALNAYGCIHGDGALQILLDALGANPARPTEGKDVQISALAGLDGLESPAAFEFLRKRFTGEKDMELKAWIAQAWAASARGARKAARGYLQDLLNAKVFHEPTVREMLRDVDK